MFIKNDLIFIFAESTLMLAVSVFQVQLKSTTVFYVKISNDLFEEKNNNSMTKTLLREFKNL